MDINLNDLLKSLGIKDSFDSKAKEAIEKERQNAGGSSIFDSQENFVNHYSEQIFGDQDEISFQDFGDSLVKSGYINNDEIIGLQVLVDSDADSKLSRSEAENLLTTVYANTTGQTQAVKTGTTDAKAVSEEELYDTVEVQPWGTGEDDCLSRIIQKHVDGIDLYTDEYRQYLEETCKLNGIDDPNLFSNKEIKLPVMKKDSNGEILKDENGKIQFYSEEELKEIKKGGTDDSTTGQQTGDTTITVDENGEVNGHSKTVLDKNGNVEKELFYNSDGTFSGYTEYQYDENGLRISQKNYNESSELVGASKYKYNDDGILVGEVLRDGNNEIVGEKEYIYDDNGNLKNIITQNNDGLVTHQEKTEYLEDGTVETTTYDENGKPTKKEIRKGDEVETIYYDDNGEPKNNDAKSAAITDSGKTALNEPGIKQTLL